MLAPGLVSLILTAALERDAGAVPTLQVRKPGLGHTDAQGAQLGSGRVGLTPKPRSQPFHSKGSLSLLSPTARPVPTHTPPLEGTAGLPP